MEAHTSLDSWCVAVVHPPTSAGQLGNEGQGNEHSAFQLWLLQVQKQEKWQSAKWIDQAQPPVPAPLTVPRSVTFK